MAIISSGGAPSDIGYWLGRKYAIMGQGADADTARAAAAVTSANASSNLDNVRASLLPQDSAAQNALLAAQTNLTGNQAQTVLPESAARVRQLNAQTGLVGAQTGLTGAQARQTDASTGLIGAQTTAEGQLNQTRPMPRLVQPLYNPWALP